MNILVENEVIYIMSNCVMCGRYICDEGYGMVCRACQQKEDSEIQDLNIHKKTSKEYPGPSCGECPLWIAYHKHEIESIKRLKRRCSENRCMSLFKKHKEKK